MSDMFAVTKDEKIAELERELKMRRHVYPRLVERKKLHHQTAARQIEILTSILKDYTP